MIRTFILVWALVVVAGQTGASAQEAAAATQPATVVVQGSGVVELVPDRAVLVLGVEIQDSVAALAAREMDRRLAAVGDTLAALGFPWDSLPNAGFAVMPVPRYGENAYLPAEYQATSSVRVTVRELDRLPDIITAGLAAGATSVTRLAFQADDPENEQARLDALDLAVAAAKRDARRLAQAAGVELGEILEIRTSRSEPLYGRYMELEAITVQGVAGSGMITPRSIRVGAQVQMTWAIER